MFGLVGWQLKLAEIIICGALCWGAYNYIGHRFVEDYKKDQIVLQIKADKEKQDKYDKLSQELIDLKLKRAGNAGAIRTEVERIIERPVYLNACIDDDGLRIINDAIKGGGISKPVGTVPTTKNP